MALKQEQKTQSFLHTKNYALFWFSSLLSNIGTWMQQVAQPWIILSLSHSSFLVGLDSFAMNAPGLIFTLWGGVLADRLDRKKVILFFQAAQFLCVVAMLVLLATGSLHVWMIIAISFFIGTTDSLSMPSFQSIIPSLVPQKDIARAVALNSTQFNLSRMLGPAIAGMIMAKFGALTCFSANVFSYIPFFISIFWIYPPKSNAVKKNIMERYSVTHWQEFKTLLASKEVRVPLMTIFVTSLFCSPLMTFCPVLIKNVFHAEVSEFGGAMAAFGLGGLLGASLGLLPFPAQMKRSRIASCIAVLLGLTVLLIAMNKSLLVLIVLMVLAGMALTSSNIFSSAFLQENANNSSRGKVVSLYQLSLQGGISLGGLLTGFAASRLGISMAFMINGSIALALQCLILLNSAERNPSNLLARR